MCTRAGWHREGRPGRVSIYRVICRPAVAEIVGEGRLDGAEDLAAIDALQVDARDAEVGVPKLLLDHHERDALVSYLDRVCVTQLMRSEPSPHTRCRGRVV